MIPIVFDVNLMRPGCPLLQAALGGDPHVSHRFPTETWLIAPTKSLKLYVISREQLSMLERKVNKINDLATTDAGDQA